MTDIVTKLKGRAIVLPDAGERLALVGTERWYLVHAQAKAEVKAQAHLAVQGFRTFVPKFLKTVRHARQLRTVRSPLFPRYLFIILDLDRDRWLCIRSTVGVSALVTCDGRPVPVPAGIVESLVARTEGSVTRLDADLAEGQAVRILSGPFTDFVGVLSRLDGNGRVRVLLNLMGSTVPVALTRSVLCRAA